MADLRSRFIEDYAGGLLNISRQELSTTGEVLSQDGLTSEGTIFVEDGSGVKSGLKLGVSLAEVVDPTTEAGVVNVRFADRTYAKIRDLKIFTTAIASAQSALSEATSTALSNLENAFELLEDDLSSLEQSLINNITEDKEKIQELIVLQNSSTEEINRITEDFNNLSAVVSGLVGSQGEDTVIDKNLIVKGESTLETAEVASTLKVVEVINEVYSIPGSILDPSKGAIQVKTISTGSNVTFSSSFLEGHQITLMLEGGGTDNVTWPLISWVGSTPTLTGKDAFLIWRANSTLFGSYLGSYA
jgi:hypothetical protein